MFNIFKNIDEAPVENLKISWDSLELNKTLIEVVKKEFKFPKMTPVQAATIPLMLKNKDVIVEAKTGSGKTLAFLLPIVESLIRIDSSSAINTHDVLTIILSPTRELASQIHQELRKLIKNLLLNNDRKLVSQLIVGGSSVASDIHKYTKFGANVVVATPGRLSGILEMADNKLSCSIRKKLAYLIFDEADQLLSLGFEKNLSSILNYLPKQRRTSLFSATQTTEVEELAKSGMRNPIRINVNKLNDRQSTAVNETNRKLEMPDKLANYFHLCDSYAHKVATLIEILRTEEKFKERKTPILKLHRRLKNKRKTIFKKFKSSKRCILLVTDILSRGIDVPDISCVIHLDLPTTPECYVHRSGRSGHQIELSGISLLLLERHELDYIELCKRRHIVLQPINLNHIAKLSQDSSQTLVEKLKKYGSKDESYQTLGIQAFVSYIRFYSSKLCLKQILYPRLSIAQLARDFGLVRLPKMPELRKNYKSIDSEFKGSCPETKQD